MGLFFFLRRTGELDNWVLAGETHGMHSRFDDDFDMERIKAGKLESVRRFKALHDILHVSCSVRCSCATLYLLG